MLFGMDSINIKTIKTSTRLVLQAVHHVAQLFAHEAEEAK